MYNICLDEEKQRLIRILIGEKAYDSLYTYQKLVIQLHFTKKDVERFKKMEQYVKEEQKKNEEKRNNKNKRDNPTD